jgi:hypothetical protein
LKGIVKSSTTEINQLKKTAESFDAKVISWEEAVDEFNNQAIYWEEAIEIRNGVICRLQNELQSYKSGESKPLHSVFDVDDDNNNNRDDSIVDDDEGNAFDIEEEGNHVEEANLSIKLCTDENFENIPYLTKDVVGPRGGIYNCMSTIHSLSRVYHFYLFVHGSCFVVQWAIHYEALRKFFDLNGIGNSTINTVQYFKCIILFGQKKYVYYHLLGRWLDHQQRYESFLPACAPCGATLTSSRKSQLQVFVTAGKILLLYMNVNDESIALAICL